MAGGSTRRDVTLWGAVAAGVLLLLSAAASDGADTAQGLSVKYPGDVGIEKDPAVLFADGFESGDTGAWSKGSRRTPTPLKVVDTPAEVHSGRYALRASFRKGRRQAGGVSQTLLPGYDELYVRWYVRFSRNFRVENDLHHQRIKGRRRGENPGRVSAGRRPTGDDAFSAGVDAYTSWRKLPGAGAFGFYSYFPTMKKGWRDRYWGNASHARDPVLIKPERWYCVEHRCKINTIRADGTVVADGEEELWVDGKRQILVTGRIWRTSDVLRCDTISMGFWMTQPPTRDQQMWIDDVVIARKYIGPRVSRKPDRGSKQKDR